VQKRHEISKKYWQDIKNFLNKFQKNLEDFTKEEVGSNCCRQAYQSIDGNSCIGRYSKGHISIGLLSK